MAPNYALFTIPLYLVVTMLPHVYSSLLIMANNNGKWDMTSPRSTSYKSRVEKSVPKECFLKFERCRAAHDNMMENMGFVVGGILSGIFTRLDADWMNLMCAVYLISRLLYTVSYVQVSSRKWAPLRTVWYMVGSIVVMILYWKAGMVLLKERTLP